MKNLIRREDYIGKDEIAKMLKTNPEKLTEFENLYNSTILNRVDNDFFNINSRQASNAKKAQQNINSDLTQKLDILINKIVNELLEDEKIDKDDLIGVETLRKIPEDLRPQLTGKLMQTDINVESYIVLLDMYSKWKETGDVAFYNRFRQGLDLLDLDLITYEILGMNPNSMGYWLPKITQANYVNSFFKIPETKVIKVPLPILQLTRLDYETLTPTTLKIVNEYCMKVFNLDLDKKYFIKTGTYSSKFDFRNVIVKGRQEVKELGEYLLYIHYQALQMASPLNNKVLYGVSTTNEWVVREYIEDVEDNPKIYKGMPLHTEYRAFVDFDTKEILGMSPYWRKDVMKKSFSSKNANIHKKYDYIIYKMHEDTLYKRYNENKVLILEKVSDLIQNTDLKGQWSIDIMQNGEDFYLIDMALANVSALVDCVDPSKLKRTQEIWLPEIK